MTSILDQLKQQAAAANDDRRLDLPIRGYDPELLVRYRFLPPNEYEEVVSRKGSGHDFLIAACDCILFRGSDGTLAPLDVGDDRGPVGFDERLAAAFDFDVDSARGTIKKLFEGPDPYGIGRHVAKLNEWLTGISTAELAGLGER